MVWSGTFVVELLKVFWLRDNHMFHKMRGIRTEVGMRIFLTISNVMLVRQWVFNHERWLFDGG